MESIKIPFDYSNFSRDILFEGIQPSTKDKKKRDFIDCCKCLVWEENRTRYELDESFRKKINLSRYYAKSLNNDSALDTWMDASIKLTTEMEFYRTSYPFNVKHFPQYPYLKYKYSTRVKWDYDPTEGRKRYSRLLLQNGLTGDCVNHLHEIQKFSPNENGKGSKREIKSQRGKAITRTVPVTINIDPLLDPIVSRKIVLENFDVVMNIAKSKKKVMEKKGYRFLSSKQVSEIKKLERSLVEYREGVYSPYDPIFKPKTLNIYNSGLHFLGLYRLVACMGLKWYEVENKFKLHFDRGGEVPMTLEHYNSRVKDVLRLFNHKKIFS